MSDSIISVLNRLKRMIMKDLHTNLGFGHGLTREVDTSRCESATFAGGCFWCMVEPFEGLEGVIKVISGYIGGYKENPTYEQVCSGTTGHYEAIQLTFDPGEISYETLLDIFWRQIDPTDTGGQFHDRGKSYRTAIFYHNEAQRQSAVDSRKELNQSCRFSAPIATLIIPATTFYPAEDYHQFYYRKSAARYLQYRSVSGRDHFLKAHWDTKRAGSNNNSINPDAEPQ